jgi:hypothetical protein
MRDIRAADVALLKTLPNAIAIPRKGAVRAEVRVALESARRLIRHGLASASWQDVAAGAAWQVMQLGITEAGLSELRARRGEAA